MNAVSLNTGWLRANRRRLIAAALAMLMASTTVIVIADRACQRASQGRIFRSTDSMPAQDVALVLGTSKTTRAGNPNLHFKHRMDAAVALYRAGKVKHLLVSGDNHIKSYDEATDMRDALVSAGVPVGAITCDYAGFRTLDSVLRAQSVFGLTNFAIVTEEFHSPRAVWIARRHRLDVVAFAAPDVPLASWSVRVKTREYLARVLCAADLYVLHRKPKFPGPPEPILLSSQAQ
jgi:vancomycin permeability regulator SanA